jgi:hypothetical protein
MLPERKHSMVKSMIKKIILGTLVASSVLMSACGGSSSSGNVPPQTSMVVATVNGGTHTLSGTYTSVCYSPNGTDGQIDSAEITGSQWVNSVKVYTGDNTCAVAPDVSTLTGTLSESTLGNVALSGWKNNNIPTAADGSGALSANETVTMMDLEITAITGTYFSVSVGYTTPTFYVVDDTDSPSITLYRDDIVDTVTSNYTASSADPLMQ